MKKYNLSLLALFFAFSVSSQEFKYGSAEYYAATGTQPPDLEASGAEYSEIEHCFKKPMYFVTSEAYSSFHDVTTKEAYVDFLFTGKTIFLKGFKYSNPKSRIQVLGIVNTGTDGENTANTYQCKDNTGNFCAVSIAFNQDTTDVRIEIAYNDVMYYYDAYKSDIPQKPYFILDNLEDVSIHDKFGSDYTNEEVYEFLAQFGTPSVIINILLRDLFYNQDFGVDNKPQEWQKQEPYKYHHK